MKRIFLIIVIVALVIIFLPKPYDRVGGVAGNQPGPWKCLGISFWPGGEQYSDAMGLGFCVGIPYK